MTRILVVGGGPGGYVAAIRASQLGAEVTLVEKVALGGTCLNAGCVPTKSLLHTAKILDEARNAAPFGVVAQPRLDFAAAMARKDAIVKQLVGGIGSLMKANKVRVMTGAATLLGDREVEVTSADGPPERLAADKIILAVGAKPVIPPVPGMDGRHCIDSTGALFLDRPPASMVVVGGGVIGVEMATAYAAMGSQITMVEMLDEILPAMDRELTRMLRTKMLKRGIGILLGAKVLSVDDHGDVAEVTVDYRGDRRVLTGEKVLVAVGRRPNLDGLGLDRIGVVVDKGHIATDDRQETNVPGVYAVGDCTGGIMLAHIASAQGEVAAENAMGHDAVFDPRTNPSCIYSTPEFAGVGLTEEEAGFRGLGYRVGRFPLLANAKTLIDGGEGLVKILVGKDDEKILGMHVLAPRATDLIAEGAVALGTGLTASELTRVIHAHPTEIEAVREAALAALGRAVHIPNR